MIRQAAMRSFLAGLVFLSIYPPILAQTSTMVTDGRSIIHQVSLTQLLATPESYDGQLVELTGYLNLAYEAQAIYRQADELTQHRLKNGLWIRFASSIKKDKLADCNHTYVVVVGTFDANAKGHLSQFGGTLTNVTGLDKQSSNK